MNLNNYKINVKVTTQSTSQNNIKFKKNVFLKFKKYYYFRL